MSIFLEVIKENVSLLIDSDTVGMLAINVSQAGVGYYYTFKIGDIIEQDIYNLKLNEGTILLRGYYTKEIARKIFSVQKFYGGVPVSVRVNIWKLIELGYVLDITKLVLRNKKIEELGI